MYAVREFPGPRPGGDTVVLAGRALVGVDVSRHYHVAEAEVRLQRTCDADEDDSGRGKFGRRPFGEHGRGLIALAGERQGDPAIVAAKVPDLEPGAHRVRLRGDAGQPCP